MPKKSLFISTMAAALGISSAACAQTMTPVAKVGIWNVMSTKDAMTDKISCVAYYGDNKRIQLTANSLAFSLSGEGGVQTYMVRLDDLPAGQLQLPSNVEKEIGALVLQDYQFEPIRRASRVRVRIFTMLNTEVDEDVDLKDMTATLAVLNGSKCTG